MILTAAAVSTLAALAGCGSTTSGSEEPSNAATTTSAPAGGEPSATAEPDATPSPTGSPAEATPSAPARRTVAIGGTLRIMDPGLYETVPGAQVEPHDGDEWSQECTGTGDAGGLATGTTVRVTDVGGRTVARGKVVSSYGTPQDAARLPLQCLLEWSAKVPADVDGLLRAEFGDTGTSTNEFTLDQAGERQALDVFIGGQ